MKICLWCDILFLQRRHLFTMYCTHVCSFTLFLMGHLQPDSRNSLEYIYGMYIYTHTHMCIYIYIYIYIYTHTYGIKAIHKDKGRGTQTRWVWNIPFLKKECNYLFIFRERGREGEREVGKHQCVVVSCAPPLGIELVTLCFTGLHSVHWATPARAPKYSDFCCLNWVLAFLLENISF